MKKMNITIENEARQFAFVKGNRAINAKTVKAKENSIKEYGQLSPIIVVKGEDVYLMDGHLVDLDGNDIPDDQTENYYAVLDGQHRLVAYLNLKLNLDDFVICEPLNVEMSIAALIAEMNICTKTWTGTDYMAAPAMMLGVENKVFEFTSVAKAARWQPFPYGVRAQIPSNQKTLWPVSRVRNCPKHLERLDGMNGVSSGMRPRKANFQIRSWQKST